MPAFDLRTATAADAAGCAAIYAPFVADSVVTFDFAPPTEAEFAARIERLGASHAWLVAATGREVLGFAYAGEFRSKPAYRWVCETTIYLAERARGQGVGRRLYGELCRVLAERGYRAAIGAIALPNPGSIALHEAAGFRLTGTMPGVGWKLGRWVDVAFYQRELGEGLASAPQETTPSR